MREGVAGAEAGPAHPRTPFTLVVSSPLSLQMQRCWGQPTRSWRPPWASPASVRGDAAGGAGAGWPSGGQVVGPVSRRWACVPVSICFISREEGSDFRPRSHV